MIDRRTILNPSMLEISLKSLYSETPVYIEVNIAIERYRSQRALTLSYELIVSLHNCISNSAAYFTKIFTLDSSTHHQSHHHHHPRHPGNPAPLFLWKPCNYPSFVLRQLSFVSL